jgi:tRNA-specific 2-thiouridylase
VFTYFLNTLQKNETPNPDILCNQKIKFGEFIDYAQKKFNADFIATGHYAQIEKLSDGTFNLLRGVDSNKDQSYFLCYLSQKQLSHSLFPLGT